MAEYVRVKDKETGHHYSVTQERYDSDSDLWSLLKQDATDSAGDPLPPKYSTTVAAKASEKQAAESANTEKENS